MRAIHVAVPGAGVIPSVWVFVLLALAAWRTWHLVADDTILEPVRHQIFVRRVKVFEFLTCPFCAGFWVAVAWWGAWLLWPHGTVVAAVPFALSAVVAVVAVGMGAMVSE